MRGDIDRWSVGIEEACISSIDSKVKLCDTRVIVTR